ncbi:hypothetical protein DAEQUDRAFT_725846 [Daedalea quercina L-15889]|uniref:Uncharacterized protein n=1 Tax=Daedalea quercina L-15889 TaxID=1314783 RepID=A0A165R2G3_9APHY|nr:hypothetical protein DAEQUDRAFT_725846 [Daedalea quercina L-15889]
MPETIASSPSQMADVHFSRVLGNLGGSLAHGIEETQQKDWDEMDIGDGRNREIEMNHM